MNVSISSSTATVVVSSGDSAVMDPPISPDTLPSQLPLHLHHDTNRREGTLEGIAIIGRVTATTNVSRMWP